MYKIYLLGIMFGDFDQWPKIVIYLIKDSKNTQRFPFVIYLNLVSELH